MSIEVKFWGVRGSIASPGSETARAGGNTSCVEVRAGDTVFVLDAGTGIRGLGEHLMRERVRHIRLLFSHLHWDHIQGLPFFAPVWGPDVRIDVLGQGSEGTSLRAAIEGQMEPPCSPVRFSDWKALFTFRDVVPGDVLSLGGAAVLPAQLDHPGGVLGWRIEHEGASVVYATDVEHRADGPDPRLVSFVRGADLLIYDGQYTEDEYAGRAGPPRKGWGHSTWNAAVALADAGKVGKLALFHHDPARDDASLDAIEKEAAALREGTVAAREGATLRIGPRRAEAA